MAEKINRTPGRKLSAKEQRIQDARARVAGFRNKLSVSGKNPDFVYRWVLDATDIGHKLARVKQLGYEMATEDDVDEIGEEFIARPSTGTDGTIIRRPSGDGVRQMYLMRIPRDFYEANQEVLNERLNEIEREIYGKADDSMGQYGEVKVS